MLFVCLSPNMCCLHSILLYLAYLYIIFTLIFNVVFTLCENVIWKTKINDKM